MFAERLNVELPDTAAAPSVNVSVQASAPSEVKVGMLQEAVRPLGNPDVTAALAPSAPVATVTPPSGVAVIVIVAVFIAGMVNVEFDN